MSVAAIPSYEVRLSLAKRHVDRFGPSGDVREDEWRWAADANRPCMAMTLTEWLVSHSNGKSLLEVIES